MDAGATAALGGTDEDARACAAIAAVTGLLPSALVEGRWVNTGARPGFVGSAGVPRVGPGRDAWSPVGRRPLDSGVGSEPGGFRCWTAFGSLPTLAKYCAIAEASCTPVV